MKNRAKCTLCHTILESFHRYDYVLCKCGEISISGGSDIFECAAKNWNNFVRVDDNDHEIIVKVNELSSNDSNRKIDTSNDVKLDKKELLDMLKRSIDYIEQLPSHAQKANVDFDSLNTFIKLLHSILICDVF